VPQLVNKAMLADLSSRVSQSPDLFVVGYKGLDVEAMTDLRRRVREAGGRMMVTKNTLTRLVFSESDRSALTEQIAGATALVFVGEEPPAVARALRDFAKDHEALELRGGMLERSVLDHANVAELADIPPRDVLIARVIGGINAPVAGFVGVLAAVLRDLVGVIDAVSKKRVESGEEVAAEPQAAEPAAEEAPAVEPEAEPAAPIESVEGGEGEGGGDETE